MKKIKEEFPVKAVPALKYQNGDPLQYSKKL